MSNDKVKEALGRLDPTEDGDWTQGGLPSMERMKQLTGNDDLTRGDVSGAAKGFNRENLDLTDKGDAAQNGQDANGNQPKPATQSDGADSQTANDAQKTGAAAPDNVVPDPGNKQFEQAKAAEEEGKPIEAFDTSDAAGLAERVADPIVLIEAAQLAAQNDRFRRNGPLQTFMRHYLVDQTTIKDHQKRLDARTEDREEKLKSSAT